MDILATLPKKRGGNLFYHLRWYVLKLIEFGLIGVGLIVLSSDNIAAIYSDLYRSLAIEYREALPESYSGPLSWLCMFLWVVLCAFFHILIAAARYFRPEFYTQVMLFSMRYFNDRIHEIHNRDFETLTFNATAQRKAIVSVLYALRRALEVGYRQGNTRVTLMLPEKRDEEVRLYIQFWANETKQTPTTRRMGRGFKKGEGYAGYAWKTGKPQVGSKKILLFFRDIRYVETSVSQQNIRSFLSIPIFDESPEEDNRPLIAVINLDSVEPFYFPRNKNKLERLIEAIRPFLHVIVFHLTLHDKFLEVSPTHEGGLVGADNEMDL